MLLTEAEAQPYSAQNPKSGQQEGQQAKRLAAQTSTFDFSLRLEQWEDGLFQRFYRVNKRTFTRLVGMCMLGDAILRDETKAG